MLIVDRKFNWAIGSEVERDMDDPTLTYNVISEPYTDENGDTSILLESPRNGETWEAYAEFYRPAA